MPSQTEQLEVSQEQDSFETASDYPKVAADPRGTDMPGRADPIGNIPLSVTQNDLPHHPGADPNAAETASSEESD
jgi:hypothetical protein